MESYDTSTKKILHLAEAEIKIVSILQKYIQYISKTEDIENFIFHFGKVI